MHSRLARSFSFGSVGIHWKQQQARQRGLANRFISITSFFPSSQKFLIESEKNALSNLADILKSLDTDPAQVKLIQETRSKLDDIFLLVVVGEFNSGKSTFINALLGRKVLKDGVLPTTEKICVLRHQQARATSASKAADGDYEELFLDDSFLKNVAIVDTPGTNGLIEKHAKLTEEVIPRSDLIIFITSAERPLSESETVLLSQICSWNRKVIVVLNKMDIAKEADKGVLVDYVSQNVARVVGNRNIEPVRIFPVSGRQALDALNGMPSDSVSGSRMQLLQNSNINELKIYLTEELSQHNIVREKLLNPLRMMDRIIETISLQLTQRERLIEGDGRTIEFIIENMSMWSASVQQDACNYKQRIQHQRTQINSRCSDFIINEINPWNIKTLVSTSIFAEKFRTEVLVDMESTIVDTKSEFRELFAKRVRQQHRSVMHYVAERIKQHQSKIMGSVNIFMDDQITDRKIFPDIDRDINLLLSDFKPAREAEVLTRAISLATVFSAVSVAGGALGASICWISGWDILLSGACCIAGLTGSSAFFWRKNKLMHDVSLRMDEFEKRFDSIMAHHITVEIGRAEKNIDDAIRPYVTFVQLEKNRILETRSSVEKVKREINDIKAQVV